MQRLDLGAIGNVAGAQYRLAANGGVQAIVTRHYGSTAPPLPYPNMEWWDDQGRIWVRTPANDAWTQNGTFAADGKVSYWVGGATVQSLIDASFATARRQPMRSVSGTTTMLAADLGGVVSFTGAGTFNLLSGATAGAGFAVTVRNAAASGDVVLDPNGVETLDGLTTRPVRPGTRVTIVWTGSGWVTTAGQYYYDSGPQTFAGGQLLTLAHGLGVSPPNYKAVARCTTAELGFSVGDETEMPDTNYFNVQCGLAIVPDATNFTIRIGATGLVVFDKNGGTMSVITAANWRLVLRAWV